MKIVHLFDKYQNYPFEMESTFENEKTSFILDSVCSEVIADLNELEKTRNDQLREVLIEYEKSVNKRIYGNVNLIFKEVLDSMLKDRIDNFLKERE